MRRAQDVRNQMAAYLQLGTRVKDAVCLETYEYKLVCDVLSISKAGERLFYRGVLCMCLLYAGRSSPTDLQRVFNSVMEWQSRPHVD